MDTDHTLNSAIPATRLASLAAVLVVVVGSMVLVGWAFDITVLKSILPIWVSMKANTAVGFILIGVSLWLTARQQSAIRNPQSAIRNPQSVIFLARLCGLLAGLIGLLTLSEYIFGWNPGIDQWLIREPSGTVGTSHPGRMAPETALDFVLLSVALWLTSGSRHIRKSTRARWALLASVSLGLLVMPLALAAMQSYLTPELGAYGWFGFTIMAMHTSMLFVILGMAVIAISWQPDVLSWSLSRRTTAAFACGIVVLVFIGFNTSRSQFLMKETNRQIAYSEEVQGDINNILAKVIAAQVHTRGYVITGNELFLKSFLSAKADGNMKLDDLRRVEFVPGEPMHQQHFTRIEAQAKELFQWFQQVIDARRTGMTDATRNNMVNHGEDLLGNLHITFDQIESEHRQIIEQLKREAESVTRIAYLIIFSGTLAGLLIFLGVIFRLNFAMNERKQVENKLAKSEQHFRAVTESANDAMITGAGAGNIVVWNAAAGRVFGYTEAEIIGQPLTVLMPERFRNLHREGLARVVAGGVPHVIGKTVELAGLRKDGSEFPLELSLAQWATAEGQFFTAIIRDVTERKQAEERIRESEARYRNIFEHAEDIIYVLNQNGTFRSLNPAFERITGWATEKWIGKPFALIIHPDDLPDANSTFQKTLSGKSTPTFRLRIAKKTGQYLDADLSITPLGRDAVMGIARDITERKQAESQLNEQLDELRRWHNITSGRERRILVLKHEINELLAQAGQSPRYPSAESDI